MEGNVLRRVLTMLMMSIMLVVSVAREDFLGLDNADAFLDVAMSPETPRSPGAPCPSENPLAPGFAPDQSASAPATPLAPEFPPPLSTPSTPGTPAPTTPLPPLVPSPPTASLPPPAPQTPLLPPETPATPFPPEGLTCEDNCAIKCSKLIIKFLFKLCFKVCNLRCKIIHSDLVYNCTNNCALSMPATLASDEEQMDSYVNSCYQKCSNHD